MAFIDQVQDLTSLTVSDNDELSQFLKDGVIDVTNRWLIVRPQDAEQFQRESSISDSQGLSVGGARILAVIREGNLDGSSDGTASWYPCRKISPSMQSRAVDVESLDYASLYNPVYAINSDKTINVYPTPSANNGLKVFYINEEPRDITNNAALIHSHSDIKYFPNDKVYLVDIYAGIRLLQATMGSNVISLTTVPPDVPTLSTVSFNESNGLSITATDPTSISLTSVTYTGLSSDEDTGSVSDVTHTVVDISGATQPAYNGNAVVGLADGTLTVEMIDTALSVTDLSISTVPPDVPTITASTVSFSQAAPTYTKPSVSLSAAPTIGNLTISVSAPTTPSDPSISGGSVGAITIDSLPSAPDYVSPTTTISGETWASEYPHAEVDITTALTALKNNIDLSNAAVDAMPVPPDTPDVPELSSVGTAPTYDNTIAASEFSDLATLIDTDEDPELAASKIQEINALMQNELNDFNEENVVFQNTMQQEVQEDTLIIQKYQADLAVYQAEIGAMSAQSQGYLQTAQGYANEIKTRLSATQVKVSEYQIRVQDALNEFNDANVVYQAGVQRNIQQAQIDMQDAQKEADLTLQAAIQDYSLELQLFQQEIAKYQAQVNDEVQEYQQNLAGDLQVWQAERTTDLQQYASDIQNELNEFNKENAAYQIELQVSIQNAQLEDAEESKKIQKYSAEVQEYQAEVNTEVQEWQANTNKDLQVWQQTNAMSLQEHSARMQDALNLFNEENVEYQAEIQEKIQQAQINNQENLQNMQKALQIAIRDADKSQEHQIQEKIQDMQAIVADNERKVAQFTAEAQHYATQVNEDVQAYTSRLQSDVQTMQAAIANNQSLLTKYQAETVEYQAEVAAETQEQSVKMQQYQLLYTQLKAEYDQAFMIAAPQQPQQAEV